MIQTTKFRVTVPNVRSTTEDSTIINETEFLTFDEAVLYARTTGFGEFKSNSLGVEIVSTDLPIMGSITAILKIEGRTITTKSYLAIVEGPFVSQLIYVDSEGSRPALTIDYPLGSVSRDGVYLENEKPIALDGSSSFDDLLQLLPACGYSIAHHAPTIAMDPEGPGAEADVASSPYKYITSIDLSGTHLSGMQAEIDAFTSVGSTDSHAEMAGDGDLAMSKPLTSIEEKGRTSEAAIDPHADMPPLEFVGDEVDLAGAHAHGSDAV